MVLISPSPCYCPSGGFNNQPGCTGMWCDFASMSTLISVIEGTLCLYRRSRRWQTSNALKQSGYHSLVSQGGTQWLWKNFHNDVGGDNGCCSSVSCRRKGDQTTSLNSLSLKSTHCDCLHMIPLELSQWVNVRPKANSPHGSILIGVWDQYSTAVDELVQACYKFTTDCRWPSGACSHNHSFVSVVVYEPLG